MNDPFASDTCSAFPANHPSHNSAEAAGMSKRPNLLVIGAMKASTSLMHVMLNQHPEVWMPRLKELNFFQRPAADEPGAFEAYLEHFRPCPPGCSIVGEASPSYTSRLDDGATARRIRDRLGRPKLVYMLRDPLKRLESHYAHACICAAAASEIEEILRAIEDGETVLLQASRYAAHLADYREVFGPDAVHIVVAEELHRDHARVLSELASYLGIAPHPTWLGPLPRVNGVEQLRRRKAASNILKRNPVLRRLFDLLPESGRQLAKGVAYQFIQKPPPSPPIPERVRGRILERLADDLAELHRELGPRIASWPSVRALGL